MSDAITSGDRIRVAVMGAAGRMGTTVCRAVLDAPDLELVAVVDPPNEGRPLDDFGVAGTAPEKAPEVLSIIDAELDRLCAERCLATAELERAKGHFKGQMALGLESSSARMERLGRSEITSGEVQSVDEMVAAIDAVGPDDVARVIDRVLAAGPRVLAAVGPVDAEVLAQRLSVGSVSYE